ncbi:hypothetical protein C8J56DRAFT_1101266 [Mycena floridula]|nr:hypothetical protein C8J56DRAFT_1101266 [Mycena floridula]
MSRSSAAARFPYELRALVIDSAYDDTEALAKFSLISKPFCAVARRHQFSIIALDPGETAAFLDLLRSPYVTLIDHMRELHFDAEEFDFEEAEREAVAWSEFVQVISPEATKYVQLLALTSVYLDKESLGFTGSLFGAVTEIQLAQICLDDEPADLKNLLSHLSSLRILRIEFDSNVIPCEPDTPPYPAEFILMENPSRLELLDLRMSVHHPLVDWFSRPGYSPARINLRLTDTITMENIQLFERLLTVFSTNLADLHVGFDIDDPASPATTILERLYLGKLRSLTLNYIHLYHDKTPPVSLMSIGKTATAVEKVTLNVFMQDLMALESFDWARVAQLYDLDKFQRLQKITIHLDRITPRTSLTLLRSSFRKSLTGSLGETQTLEVAGKVQEKEDTRSDGSDLGEEEAEGLDFEDEQA